MRSAPTMQRLRTIDGKYAVRGTIGSGGMGVVLEAEHIGIGRVVAVKVLHPHLSGDEVQVKRFMREARTAGMSGHPNVCTVFDLGTLDDGRPYLVMERLVGQSLATRLEGGRTIQPDRAVDILLQMLSGLDAVHQAGVVHRDVKPDNVFLVERPEAPNEVLVKILDFGTSKPMNGPERDLTGTGIAIGTAYYMSPEQARGERDLDGRVDVYACGVMLYEMLAGKRPFSAPSEHAVLLRILSDTPVPLSKAAPHVPSVLEPIVAKAMARERDERYQSAAELARALEDVRQALGDPTEQKSSRPEPPRFRLPSSVRIPVARGFAAPPSEPTIPLDSQDLSVITELPKSPEPKPPSTHRSPTHTSPTRVLTPSDDDANETTRIFPPRKPGGSS